MVLFQSSSLVWILHALSAKVFPVRSLTVAGLVEMFHCSLSRVGKFHEETHESDDKRQYHLLHKNKEQSMLNEELHEKKWHFRNWKHLDYNLNSWTKL